MAKKLSWWHWALSVVIAIALINWGTLAWFNFDIVKLITFDIGWLATTIYTIVAVAGLIGIISLIVKTFD